MIQDTDQIRILSYVLNMVSSQRITPAALSDICSFIEVHALYEDCDNEVYSLVEEFQSVQSESRVSRKLFNRTLKAVKGDLAERCKDIEISEPSQLVQNVRSLSLQLELADPEEIILLFIFIYRFNDDFYRFLNDFTSKHMTAFGLCVTCLGIDKKLFAEKTKSTSRLISSGLIVVNNGRWKDIDDVFDVPGRILDAMKKSLNCSEDVRKNILGIPASACLQWQDFEHLAQDKDRLACFIREAVKQQLRGVNILLWGPPGTGKTEFCKTIAAHLGINLYSLGETDEDGCEPSRKERMAELRLAQNLLKYQTNKGSTPFLRTV